MASGDRQMLPRHTNRTRTLDPMNIPDEAAPGTGTVRPTWTRGTAPHSVTLAGTGLAP
jgi:hypothetical protein